MERMGMRTSRSWAYLTVALALLTVVGASWVRNGEQVRADGIAPCPLVHEFAFGPASDAYPRRTLTEDAYVFDAVGGTVYPAGTQIRDDPSVSIVPIVYEVAMEDVYVWNFNVDGGYREPEIVRSGERYTGGPYTYAEPVAAPVLAPAPEGRSTPAPLKYVQVFEDTIVTDITGVHLVRAGGIVIDAPTVRTRRAAYQIASCDVTVSTLGDFRRVKVGERYLTDVFTFPQPDLPYPTVFNTPIASANRPIITVRPPIRVVLPTPAP